MSTFIRHTISTHKRKIYAVTALVIFSLLSYVAYFRFFGALPQSTITLFQNLDHAKSTDTVLVFSPHQDDETLGSGGFVANAISNGAHVYIVFATDGNHLRLKERRQQEAIDATTTLGVSPKNLTFYNFPDTRLENHRTDLDARVINTIQAIKPTIIFVTDPEDIHSDHAALGTSVHTAVEQLHDPSIHLYTFIIHYPKYPRPQQFRPQSYLLPPTALLSQSRQWLRFDLSHDAFDKKNEAVLQYKSQLRTPLLHSLMMSFVRENEMFSKETP